MTAHAFLGHCLCKAVSVAAKGAPVSTVNCHCADCRRATGAVFGTVLYFPKDAVRITGTLSGYIHLSDRGTNVTRQFCPTCGSQKFARADAWPNLIGVRAGCLAETDCIQPQRNVFVSSMIPSTPLGAYSGVIRPPVPIASGHPHFGSL